MKEFNSYEKLSLTVDAVVISCEEVSEPDIRRSNWQRLKVLLVKRKDEPFKGKWALPGGFVDVDKTLEDSVLSKFSLKTGVEKGKVYLEQLRTYGDLNRDPRGRVVSVAYLAVVPYDLEKGEEAEWFTISTRRDTNGNIEMLAVLDEYNNSIELAFDHKKMLIDALDRLKNKVLYTDVVLQVLPSEFTLRTAQDIYETLAGKEIPSFRRYIKDKVEGTGCIKSGAGHRPSELYRVKI